MKKYLLFMAMTVVCCIALAQRTQVQTSGASLLSPTEAFGYLNQPANDVAKKLKVKGYVFNDSISSVLSYSKENKDEYNTIRLGLDSSGLFIHSIGEYEPITNYSTILKTLTDMGFKYTKGLFLQQTPSYSYQKVNLDYLPDKPMFTATLEI